ncbi:hypothetical protein Bca52824_059424 [Brassica carinata]|uniref:Zinc finger GRF-type domain-containing protein n=1 Tax=Brassica carinata TaxID=52824 RepID=A0A8X7UFN7_BRACI|nr:hypothetical protein Bca52824_059424 [Brassica carinata]
MIPYETGSRDVGRDGPRRREKRDEEAKGALHHASMRLIISDSARCMCGSRIINEVRGKEEYDSLPGKRFFTCKNYEDDGLHFRHPWVFGVQEEIESLTKRVKESEEVILLMAKLNKQIETLEEQVHDLNVKVHVLQKLKKRQ